MYSTINNIIFLTLFTSSVSEILLQTNIGLIQGRDHISSRDQKPFYSFRGIPYAEPPIDKLRFADPIPKTQWDGILNSTEDQQPCVQDGENGGSEDCLFLNIFTPTVPTQNCSPLPVLAWIHGGAFLFGGVAFNETRPDNFVDKDIVVVTIHYRLGVLGFLSTEDTTIPGNFGLKDQLLALKWIKTNIASFCGDPDQITIAGQSAGAASVAYHLQSPKSKGFFNRAILQSGTSLCLWSFSRRAKNVALAIGEKLGLDTTTSDSLLEGLRNVNISELSKVASSEGNGALITNIRGGFIFAPVSEPDHPNAFFTGKSHQVLSEGAIAQVPVLMGYNSLEGKFNFAGPLRAFIVSFDLNHRSLIPMDSNIKSEDKSQVGDAIKDFYFKWIPASLSKKTLLEYISDDQFVRPILEFARVLHQYTQVYLYRFSYEGGLSNDIDRTVPGVSHSEELAYFWQPDNLATNDHDYVVQERLLKMWTDFIKIGNPTPIEDPVLQNIIWQPVDANLTYLEINDNLVVSKHEKTNIVRFWNKIYEKYGNPPYDTY